MVRTNEEPDLESLLAWQARLSRQADDLRAVLQSTQDELAHIEERLALVTKLIEVETRAQAGTEASDSGDGTEAHAPTLAQARSVTPDLEDAVEDILRTAGAPLHISKIREALLTQRVTIPGRGDDANIIVRLRRFEDRFTRTARGTYGLAEWGIPPLKNAARRQRRTVTR